MDTATLAEKLLKPVESLAMVEVCRKPLCYPCDFGDHEYQPNVTFFEVSDEFMAAVEPLFDLRNSIVLCSLWRDACLDVQNSTYGSDEEETVADVDRGDGESAKSDGTCLTLDDVVTHVWQPCKHRWVELCDRLFDGSLSVGDADDLFIDFASDFKLIEEQMNIMLRWRAGPMERQVGYEDDEIKVRLTERLTQFEMYKKLNQYHDGVAEILRAKELLKLTGDFTDLETVHQMVCNSFDFFSALLLKPTILMAI